jgi:hypothetical protein
VDHGGSLPINHADGCCHTRAEKTIEDAAAHAHSPPRFAPKAGAANALTGSLLGALCALVFLGVKSSSPHARCGSQTPSSRRCMIGM